MSGVTSLSNLSNSTFTFPIEVVLLSSAYGRQGPKPLTWTNLPFFNLLQDISNNSTEYTYDKSLTPQLLALSSSMGEAGSTVSVYGANFTSKTFVQFGDISCNNATLKNSTCISCILSSGYIGFKQVSAYIPGLGFAFVDPAISTFAFTTRVLAVWPTTASLSGSTTVKISYSPIMMSGIPTVNITTGNAPCSITFLNSTYLECLTSPLSNQDTSLVYPNFLINGVSADYSNCSLAVCGFKFGASVTPSIQSLNPIRGSNATILEIDGINFGTILSDVSVFLEGALLSSNPCSTVNVTASKIFCTIWPMEAGSYSVVVILNGRGQASGYLSFEYALSVKSSGGRLVSGVGGGETITLTGDGFGQSTSITVCGFDCPITSYSQSIISCLSPSVTTLYDMTNFSSSLQNTTCAVDILDAPEFVITNYNYTYAPTLTPIISLVSPIVGGTAGGTILTITGSGFGDNSTKTTVQIGSSMCSVSFINSTTIKCTTSATNAGGDFTVVVYVAGKGNSYSPQNIIYSYTDRWSSQFTWGNSTPPVDGDSVWIPANKSVTLDVDSPILQLLLIEGTLVFDNLKNLSLQAHYILLHNGGRLQIGTESKPYNNSGLIRLWGNIRNRPLPTYGSKVLAIRNGFLDIHGTPLNHTWTRLLSTAFAGSNVIYLRTFVNWPVGGTVVLSSSSATYTDVDKAVIIRLSAGTSGSIVTLDSNLNFTHSGAIETFNGATIDYGAEVALISRNIVVEGVLNNGHSQPLVNNYNDQFGGHVMMHPSPVSNGWQPHMRLSYVEFRHMGQAYQLGRYPVHYHMDPNVGARSYVNGCSIHDTFNRALTAHAVYNLTIKRNVAFNTMGHTFFVEDGIEEHNSFIENLGIMTHPSFSLLNTDQIPATFWITNPNNNYIGNVAAGSAGSGFFFNLQPNPTGPSFTPSICPRGRALGIFTNNTAHSSDFGFRIWEVYNPLSDPSGCWGNPLPVTFSNFIGYANRRGAEVSEGGAITLSKFAISDCYDMQMVWTEVDHPWGTAFVSNATVVARSQNYVQSMGYSNSNAASTSGGILTPYSFYLTIEGITFVNFDLYLGSNIVPCSFCKPFDGAFETRFSNVNFINATSRVVAFNYEHQAYYTDLDGSLTGLTGGCILPSSGILPSDSCVNDISSYSAGIYPGAVCDNTVVPIRFGSNSVSPDSFNGQSMLLINPQGGQTKIPWEQKRVTHPFGYTGIIIANQTYTITFDVPEKDLVDVTSMRATVYGLPQESFVLIQQSITEKIDHFNIRGNQKNLNYTPGLSDWTGEWTYDNTSKLLEWIFVTPWNNNGPQDWDVWVQLDRCPDGGCVVPSPPKPNITYYSQTYKWSDPSWWPNNTLPTIADDVFILAHMSVILDVSGVCKNIYIYGNLTFSDTIDLTFDAYNIFVMGTGRLTIGTTSAPFAHNAVISLHGNHTSETFAFSNTVTAGSKALAVFGTLEIVGKTRTSVPWTRLSQSANTLDNVIYLATSVDWLVGDSVLIASSSYEPWQYDIATISAVSPDGTTLTLSSPLIYTHAVAISQFGGFNMNLAPEVALLNRSIVIQGAEDDSGAISVQHFGARVYVSSFLNTDAYSDDFGAWPGTAVITNVELRNCGQEGYTDSTDYRAAITFDYGDVGLSPVAESLVSNCVIKDSYNSAIAVMYFTQGATSIGASSTAVSGSLPVSLEYNVAFKSVGSNYKIYADNINMISNLAAICSFALVDDAYWIANFDILGDLGNFEGNAAAGSESVGIMTVGLECNSTSFSVTGNSAHSNIYGLIIWSIGRFLDGDCTGMDGSTIWKSWNIGIFPFVESSVTITNSQIADSRIGFMGISIGPSDILHQTTDRETIIRNSLFVGYSSNEKCLEDETIPETTLGFYATAAATMPYFTFPNTSPHYTVDAFTDGVVYKSGIMFSYFLDNSGGHIQLRDFTKEGKMVSWPILSGKVEVHDSMFANFHGKCNNRSYAITNNYNDDDASKSHLLYNVASTNVEQDSMIFFYDPRPDWVTGILCVDMDCDGLKHSMIVDFNGTFFGSNGVPTTAIPDASINFNPNFVPVIMRTNLDGSIMELDQLYNNTGIYTDGCVWMESWNAYSCPQTSYNLLVIESMDADSLTRRLSPVALMAVDENAGNYLNLLNGPKQVGWCAHYACLKRPSTFYGVVAQNLTYRVALTGTNPSSMRLWNLYAQDSDSVKLVIDWPTSQRLDVYCNSALVLPTDQNVTHQYGENLSVYDPSITTATSGAHFYRIDLEQLTVIIKGSAPILIQSSPAVLIALGITSPNADAFFDTGSLISNLAAFLGINPITLKIVNIVPETVTTPSKNRFAKRITSTKWNIKIQIANPPASTLTSSMTTTTTMTTKMSLTTSTGVSTASNVVSTTSVSSSSSPTPSSNSTTDAGNQNLNTAFNQQVQQYAQQVQQQTALANLASNLVSAFQSNMQNILPNATISSLSVQLPPAPAVPPIPPTVSANSSVAQILTNLTMQDLNVSSSSNSSSSSSSSSPLSFQIPSQMVAQTTIQGTIMYQLPTLVFQVLDSSGNLVHNLGLANSQWKLQAYLFTSNTSSLTNSSGGSIKLSSSPIVNVTNLLIGTTLQSFVGGKATFNDLSISSSGDGFSLAFVPFSGSSSMSSFYYATGSFSFIAPSSPSGTGGGGATTSPTGSSSSPLSSTGFPLYGIIIVTVVGALVIGSLAAFVTVKRKREARRQLKGKGKMVEPRDSFEPTAKNNIRAESSAAQVPVIRTSQVSVDEMDKSAEHLASPIASQAILVSFYEAIEPYTPDILFQDELAIKTGDIIQVISSSSDKVWYVGHSLTSNKSGRFPIRCVKPILKGDPRLTDLYEYAIRQDREAGHQPSHLPPLEMSIQVEQDKIARLMTQGNSSESTPIPRPLNRLSSVKPEDSKVASTSARLL